MNTSDNILHTLTTGARQGLIGSIGGRFLSVLGNIFAARILGPSVFGVYAIGWTLFRFVSLIMPLGMDRSFIRFGPVFWKKDCSGLKGLLIQTTSIALGSGFLFGLIMFCIAPWLATVIYQKPELITIFRLYSFIFPVITLLIVFSAITRMTQNVKYSVILQDLGQPLVGLILMGIFYFAGLRLKGVIFADVFSFSLSCLAGLWVIFRLFPEIIKSTTTFRLTLKDLFSYSIPAAFGGAFSVYIFWIDRILVGYYCASFQNGIYLAVSQISTLFLVISAGINGVVVPVFSDLFNQGEAEKLNEVYKISTKWGLYISAPFLAVLLISPGDVLGALYGESFRDGASILVILIVGQFVNLITGSVNPLLGMTGNQRFLFRLSGLIFVFDVIANVILIPRFGLTGAAISTSFSISALYIVELFWVKKKMNLWPYDRRYLKGILALVVSFGSVYGIRQLYISSAILYVLIQVVVAVVAFGGMLYFLKLDEEDRYFISSLVKSLSKKAKQN